MLQLHGCQEWLEDYWPTCSTGPDCKWTVQVDNQCFYAGNVNYVTLGRIVRLCCHVCYHSKKDTCRTNMVMMIRAYKGGTPSFMPSVEWAIAGFEGWPETYGTPPSSYPKCRIGCPTKYHNGLFEIRWDPIKYFCTGRGPTLSKSQTCLHSNNN